MSFLRSSAKGQNYMLECLTIPNNLINFVQLESAKPLHYAQIGGTFFLSSQLKRQTN